MTPPLEVAGGRHEAFREVLPGAYLIELPLPFSLASINVFLVRLARGYLLIDCGMDTEPCFAALEGSLEEIGVAWNEVHEILLTHVHPDHMGLTPKLLRLTGARLSMHRDDLDFLNKLADREQYKRWESQVLREAGVTEEMIEQIHVSSIEMHRSFHKLAPGRVLAGSERVPTAIGDLEVLLTPGHSPGHVCLYSREQRVLFSGDQIIERISPNIGWQPNHDAVAEYLASLDELAKLDIDLILPSHGAPFSGHREWIRKAIEHHADRCARILDLLDGGPKSAADLVGGLWDRKLSSFHYRFATFEILAHLEHLERQKKVTRIQPDQLVAQAFLPVRFSPHR